MGQVTQLRKPPPMRRGGYYWIKNDAGVEIPLLSVTNALDEVAKQDFFVPAAIRKAFVAWSEDPSMSLKDVQATWYKHTGARASFGRMAHSLYEAHGRGATLTPDDLSDELKGHFEGFLSWFRDIRPKFIQVESKVANFSYGYAGQGDLWGEIAGELAIIDYKTGFLDEFSTAMQLSAYQHSEAVIDNVTHERSKPLMATLRYALQTRENGTYNWVKLPDRFDDFLAYLHAWRARHNEECLVACWCQNGSIRTSDPAWVTVCRECAAPEGTPHLSDCQYSVFRNFDDPQCSNCHRPGQWPQGLCTTCAGETNH